MTQYSEERIQFEMAQWLRHEDITFFHVPNGGMRCRKEGAKFKAIGVRAGVHDLIILLPNATALFIELKTDSGELSKAQEKFHSDIVKLGFDSRLIQAANPQEALDQLRAILQSYTG